MLTIDLSLLDDMRDAEEKRKDLFKQVGAERIAAELKETMGAIPPEVVAKMSPYTLHTVLQVYIAKTGRVPTPDEVLLYYAATIVF